MEIGLGVPRKTGAHRPPKRRAAPVAARHRRRFHRRDGRTRAGDRTGLPAVEGFILKTRSPSCGPYDV
jgi:uncharacterized protein YbbK (DUF523 family)